VPSTRLDDGRGSRGIKTGDRSDPAAFFTSSLPFPLAATFCFPFEDAFGVRGGRGAGRAGIRPTMVSESMMAIESIVAAA